MSGSSRCRLGTPRRSGRHRATRERCALAILVEPGRLAHECELCVRVTLAENDLCPASVERAARAAGRPSRFLEKVGCTIGAHRDTVRPAPAGSPRRRAGESRRGLVAAAAAAAAATAAPRGRREARLRLGAVDRERRQLPEYLRGTAARALHDLALGADELLEVLLALHACVLVDRHGRSLDT